MAKVAPLPSKPLNATLDLDYERYFDEDFDVMGNPINYDDISLLHDEVVRKSNTLTENMYFIQEIPVLTYRLCELPTRGQRDYVSQHVYFMHGTDSQSTNYKCTNISISK